MRALSKACLLVLFALLTSCATTHPVEQAWDDAEDTFTCDAPGEDQCVVLACAEGMCGFFRCEDVVPATEEGAASAGRVVRVRNSGPPPTMFGPASPRRWWGRSLGLPNSAQPVLTFRWYPEAPPVRPVYQLPPGRYVRHHVFPQARDLREWFEGKGIDIHQFTLLIPEHVHIRIHRGGARGGLWNEAWRDFRIANEEVPRDVIYRHAGELLFRFELTGQVRPYYRQFR